MNLHIDIGQIIIATLIAIVGYFIKKEISNFGARLDRHEQTIFIMAQNMSTVIGQVGIISKLVGVEAAFVDMHKIISSKRPNE